MSTIVLFLTAITELAPLFTRIFTLYLEARKKGWVNSGRELSAKVEGAVTDEERMRLARDLFKHRA